MAEHRTRKLILSLVVVALVVAAIELVSLLLYRVSVGNGFSYAENAAARAALLASGGTSESRDGADVDADVWRLGVGGLEILHPFVGYVHQPSGLESELMIGPWGFLERADRLGKPGREDAYRIAVVGGSVAVLFGFNGGERLVAALEGAPFLQGRPVEIETFALGGMKQPQQLMTVTWMLSVGKHFDLVVNIDGYNEVVFGAENARRGVHPAFPRNWALRVGGKPSFTELEALGRVAAWSRLRRGVAGAFDAPIVGQMVTGNLLWRLLNHAVTDRISEAEEALAEIDSAGLGFEEKGPPFEAHDADEIYRMVAEHWARASILLDRMCRGNGIRYVHLLQPNQYVPGSKPMGRRERSIAIDPKFKNGAVAARGYPKLIAEAETLGRAAVEFHDLTRMFEDERAPVYADTCCHFNRYGNERIAERLADILVAAHQSSAHGMLDGGVD